MKHTIHTLLAGAMLLEMAWLATCTLKAIAYKENMSASPVASESLIVPLHLREVTSQPTKRKTNAR